MALRMTPIHKNLHMRVTLMGLEFEDLLAVLALAIVMNFLSRFVSDRASILGIPLNIFMEVVFPVITVPGLMLFKYGKPRGYLQDLVKSWLAPHAWCVLERDAILTGPYLREDEDPMPE